MKKNIGVMGLIFLAFLCGCENDKYAIIPKSQAFIASVNLKDSSITFVDGGGFNVITEWDLDEPINGAVLLPGNDTLAVYGKEMDQILIYSLSQGKLKDKWQVGRGIVQVSLINDKTELALVDQNTDSIRIFSLEGEEKRAKTVGNNPFSIFEDRKSGRLYVVNYNDVKISVFHTDTLKEVMEFPINTFSTGIILPNIGDQIWVGGHGEGKIVEENVHIYSSKTGRLVDQLRAPSMPVKFLEHKDSMYVVSHGSSKIYKWDISNGTSASVKVGANPFDIKEYNDKMIIASYDSDDIHIVNAESLKTEKKVKVGTGPFQLFVRE